MGHGWLMITFRKNVWVAAVMALSLCISVSTSAGTIREITTDNNEIKIALDSPISTRAVKTEIIRDFYQVSIEGASLYPAKIENFEGQAFTKLFAYQYAPNLVRVRFTLADPSESNLKKLGKKIKLSAVGKNIQIEFPIQSAGTVTAEENPKLDESTLLKKVLGNSNTNEAASVAENDTKNKKLTNKSLAVRKNSPSPVRGILIMMLMMGAMVGILFWIKKKSSKAQVSKKGNWFSQLTNGLNKKKSFIEVLGNTPLGPKQNILLVKIRGQQMVLGVTQDRIQLITQLDADSFADQDNDILDDPSVSESLSQMLGGAAINSTMSNAIKSHAPAGATSAPQRSIVSKNSQNTSPVQSSNKVGSFRDEIRKRMETMKSL